MLLCVLQYPAYVSVEPVWGLHLLAYPEEEFLQIDYSQIPHDGVEKIPPDMRTKFMRENHTVLLKSPNFLIDLGAVSSHFLANAAARKNKVFR